MLGEREARDFLADVLRIASEGLTAGRSARLIRDEIQANLARRLQSAEGAFLAVTAAPPRPLAHAGRRRPRRRCRRRAWRPAAERAALAERATRLEKKGDRLTLEAREIAGRLKPAPPALRQVIDEVEEALDALDEAAFLFSLLPDPPTGADLVAAAGGAGRVRRGERAPDGARLRGRLARAVGPPARTRPRPCRRSTPSAPPSARRTRPSGG